MTILIYMTPVWAARKALVIGNAAYKENPLRNPENDAKAVAKTIERLGFEVTLIKNADLEKMDKSLDTFVLNISSKDEVLFYYSGHGVNVDGENYLIPVGRIIRDEDDVKYRTFNCNLVLAKLQKARLTIMVLDACRDNPYRGIRSSNKGLVSMQGRAGSQYIIFSTEQGRTAADGSGSYSPFTEAFVKHLYYPEKIEDMMKKVTLEVKNKTFNRQIPWTSGNLIEDFYFNTPSLQNVRVNDIKKKEELLIDNTYNKLKNFEKRNISIGLSVALGVSSVYLEVQSRKNYDKYLNATSLTNSMDYYDKANLQHKLSRNLGIATGAMLAPIIYFHFNINK